MNAFLVILLSAYVFCNEDDLRRIDSIFPEQPCNDAHGGCVVAKDCPPGRQVGSGLCPKQRSEGVECCSYLSMKETRCEKYGGKCKSKHEHCSFRVISQANDCNIDQVCCPFISRID